MNLFWSTRALTNAREDHLTEFFAAALEVSPPFRKAYANLVIAPLAQKQRWGNQEIVSIQTQVSYTGTDCRPDMVLKLSNQKRIAVEHKLDALESSGAGEEIRSQLERYLRLPIDGLAYVRSSWKPPSNRVLAHPLYIHPSEREHFLWRDFYHLMPQGDHQILDWLREGFERLGFTPPHPSIGELKGMNAEQVRKNRLNFAKFWGKTRSFARGLGWRVTAGSIVELYMQDNPNSLASLIFVDPEKFDSFLFRATPRHEEALEKIEKALKTATTRSPYQDKIEIMIRQVRRKYGKEAVVDLTTSLHEILGTTPLQPEEIENRLLAFLMPLLNALQGD